MRRTKPPYCQSLYGGETEKPMIDGIERIERKKMLEVEMKFRVADAAEYENRLKTEFGIEFGPATPESDVFFTNAALGFPNAGKSLRIRRRGAYLATTFKGPRLDSATKTREEIELRLFSATEDATSEPTSGAESSDDVEKTRADWIRFYERLGFAPFAQVEKVRRRGRLTFDGREYEITLDKVAPLGFFTEIETMAPRAELGVARSATLRLAAKLRLGETVVKSYLALLMENESGRTVEEK